MENLKKEKEEETKCVEDKQFYEAQVAVQKCVFIATKIENPVEISTAIMDRIIESKTSLTNTVIRLIPVQKTCKAFIENIDKAAQELMKQYLPKDTLMSYCIVVNIRNNSLIKKEEIVNRLSLFACDHNKKLKLSTKSPDVVLNIDIMKKICCLGFLPDYFTKYHKYNLNTIATKALLLDKETNDNDSS